MKKVYLALFSLSLIFISLTSLAYAYANPVIYDTFDKSSLDTSQWVGSKTSWYLQNGNLNFYSNTPYIWGNAAIYSKNSFTSNPGRTLSAILRASVFDSIGPYALFSPNSFPANRSLSVGTGFDGGGGRNLHVYSLVPGAAVSYNNGVVEGNDYLVATTIRPSGSYHFVSGGEFGTFPSATLVWVNDKPAASTNYIGIDGKQISSAVPEIKAVDLTGQFTSQYGLAKLADTFHRSDNPSLGNTEVGNTSWVSTNMRVMSNTLTASDSTATASAQLDTGITEGIFEVNFTTSNSSPALNYYFRQKDDNNWWRVSCDQNQILLQKSISGTITTILPQPENNSILSCQPNTNYRLVVRAHGASISVWLNNIVVGNDPLTTDDSLLDGSITKIELASGSGIQITSFAAWPKMITLPPELGPFPTVPDSGNTTLIQDNFTDTDGKHLKNHLPITGGSWQEITGNWVINGNAVTPSPRTPYTIATIDSGKDDHSITMKINLAGSTELETDNGGWMIGPIIRYKDQSNYVWARFLWQGGSPEIEVWENVNGQGNFLNAKNITRLVNLSTTHIMKSVAIGKKIAIYLDGKLIEETETNLSTGTQVGMVVDNVPGTPISTISQFTVTDTTRDTMPPTEVTDLNYFISSPNLYFTWSAPNDDASGVKFYRLYRSTSSGSLGTQINTDGTTTSSPFMDISNPPTGRYYYTLRAVDRYGNENTSGLNKQLTLDYVYSPPGPGGGPQKPAPINTLFNSSFETIGQFNGGFPDKWQWQPNTWRATNNSHTGVASVGIQGPATGLYSYQSPQGIIPNTKYTLSGWVKTSNVTGDGVSLRFVQDNIGVISQTQSIKGTADWTFISTTFTTTSTYSSGRVDIFWTLNTGDAAWVDDVKLERITYPNLIANASFETLGTGTNPSSLYSGTSTYPITWAWRGSATSGTSVHSGSRSLKIFGPADYTYSQENITLKPATYYSFTYWIRTSNVLGKGVSARYAVLDPPDQSIYYSPWNSGTSDWRKVSSAFVTPPVINSGRFDLWWNLAQGDTAWIDDVSLCERECL